jgi:hypothetical protein
VPTPAPPLAPQPVRGAAPEPSATAIVAEPDSTAPTFGIPATQLGASAMTVTGLSSVTVVTVSFADGTTAPVLRIVADGIVLTDAVIDVRSTSGSGLVTASPRMELVGAVRVYLDSLTATLPDGTTVTLSAASPPSSAGLSWDLTNVTLGLIGTMADSISYSHSHQSVG